MVLLNEKISKATLRKKALDERKVLSKLGFIDKFSKIITKKIIDSADYKNAKNIALYCPIQGEIDILKIMHDEDKNYYFPKCDGDSMTFSKANSINDFKIGMYNIMEPCQNEPFYDFDLIYIPCLLANKNRYRLGYGKGYYDKFFLKNNIKAKKIIVTSDKFVDNSFVEDEFDVQSDEILTEKDIF